MTTTRAPERPVGTTTPPARRVGMTVLAVLGFLALTAAAAVAFFAGMLSGFDNPDNAGSAYFAAAAVLFVAPWLVTWAVTRRTSWGVATFAVGVAATLAALWGVGTI